MGLGRIGDRVFWNGSVWDLCVFGFWKRVSWSKEKWNAVRKVMKEGQKHRDRNS